MKKVLFLAYYFPPMGGGGVQRIAKFCKYLPLFGYSTAVVAGPSESYGHPDDQTLCLEVKDIPRYDIQSPKMNTYLRRILASDFGRFFQWHQIQWLRNARQAGEAAIQKEKPDLICASVSPFPMARVAAELSEKHRIPWVLDMRDPWALDPVNVYTTKLHYTRDFAAMKWACRRADAAIMNTPDSLDAARKSFPAINPDKFSCITNGWDAEDFKSFCYPRTLHNTSRPLTMVHTGVFHTRAALSLKRSCKSLKATWKKLKNGIKYSVGDSNMLTRTPHYLFEAISNLLKQRKISEKDLRIIFAGHYTPDDIVLAQTHGVDRMVEFCGYVDHNQSIQMLNKADVLFLPLHEPQDMLPLIVPGKTYEYLAARRPILAPVPQGDARRFVQQAGLGYVCDPTDVDNITSMILDMITHYKSPTGLCVRPNEEFIERFERKQLTRQLAALFDNILSNCR